MKYTRFLKLLNVSALFVIMTSCASTPHQESAGQYIDNSAITTEVKSALLTDPNVKSFPITVNTYKGVVQLSGFVETAAEAKRAGEIASSVQGVRMVKNDLKINHQMG